MSGAPERVSVAVAAWRHWLQGWRPASGRGQRVCALCHGSPFVAAAGFSRGQLPPHEVLHNLFRRLQSLIDERVNLFIAAELPLMRECMRQDELSGQQQTLFPLSVMGRESADGRLVLSAQQKRMLAADIARADDFADAMGREICFQLVACRQQIGDALKKFVDPKIEEVLAEFRQRLEQGFS